jgi:hypothetical protein
MLQLLMRPWRRLRGGAGAGAPAGAPPATSYWCCSQLTSRCVGLLGTPWNEPKPDTMTWTSVMLRRAARGARGRARGLGAAALRARSSLARVATRPFRPRRGRAWGGARAAGGPAPAAGAANGLPSRARGRAGGRGWGAGPGARRPGAIGAPRVPGATRGGRPMRLGCLDGAPGARGAGRGRCAGGVVIGVGAFGVVWGWKRRWANVRPGWGRKPAGGRARSDLSVGKLDPDTPAPPPPAPPASGFSRTQGASRTQSAPQGTPPRRPLARPLGRSGA